MHVLADMEAFVEVARARHFGKAAAALGVTASTLSRRVTALERELGVMLIRRSTRSFALTESGQKLFARAATIVEEALRTKQEIGADFVRMSGHIRAGSPSDLATTLLARVFAQFCRENPGVTLDVVSTQGQPDLLRDGLDVAFAVGHQIALPDSACPARQIGSFSRMMYASRAYLRRRGVPNAPHEITGHACIRYVSGATERQWELHQGRRRQTIAVDGTFASSSVIVAAQAAREHLGIAMLPEHLATHPTFGAGLTRILPDWEGTRANVFAITADRALSAKLQELIRVARTEFAKRVALLEAGAS